jgi:hypothetical protein
MDTRRERLEREAAQRHFQQQRRQAAERQRSYDNRARQILDDKYLASFNRQQAALNSYRPPSAPPSPVYDYPAGSAQSAPTASKYRAARNLGIIAAVLTALLVYAVPHISGQLAQISGAGHGATAIGAGLTAGFVTLVIVGIIISIVEWIKNHPLLFILAAGFAIYAWVHSHSSP